MAFYEHTFVGRQDLSKKQVDNLVEKYSDLIKKSGKILKTEMWGIINLTQKIKKNKKGIFIHFKIESENNLIKDIEKKISLDSNIIRHLTVKYEDLDLKKEYFGKPK
tara:strand:- start:1059 stop:1379 length:321 start_codon:yes stop_codon:yes gene_type:complete